MFHNLLKKISSHPLSFESWLLSALGIVAIRIFLEQYSNNLSGHFVLIDLSTIVQYTASFITILLSCTAVVLYFTKKSLREIASITLFAFTIIWLAPILDIIISAGKGYPIHYIFLSFKELVLAFFTGFWSTTPDGMTYGIRIEIMFVVLGAFAVIYTYTKHILKSLAGALMLYFSIFLVDCIPSFLGIFQTSPIPYFIQQSITRSTIITNSTFSIQNLGFSRLMDLGFNSLMSQVNLIIALIAIFFICVISYREKAKILIANARPERILHYALLVIIGAILGGGKGFFSSWVNILSLLVTIVAFAMAWFSAVCINDIEDRNIDVISNKNRPLPRGLFTDSEFRTLAKVSLLIACLSAYSASLYGLFFVILYSFIFYLYSTGPIKLKRHFVSGALVIGFASISAVLSGFFLSVESRELFSFPPLLVLCLVLFFGFSSMIKDLKDYEGDLANGIKTLPVLLGLKRSKVVIATVITGSMVGMSLYLGNKSILIASIVTAVLVWIVLMVKNYKEKRFFAIYLLYLFFCLTVFLLR